MNKNCSPELLFLSICVLSGRFSFPSSISIYRDIEEGKLKPTQITANRPENQTGHK